MSRFAFALSLVALLPFSATPPMSPFFVTQKLDVATMKSSGFVAQALKRHGIEGAAVAP